MRSGQRTTTGDSSATPSTDVSITSKTVADDGPITLDLEINKSDDQNDAYGEDDN
ncbi:MAG: hypothetical protein ACOC0O_04035 [Spirochaetota bacterium]